MIESEAKQKWCPFARMVIPDEGAMSITTHNRAAQAKDATADHVACIASDCMAWRWIPEVKMPHEQSDNEGYCGLAGKP